MSRGDWTAIELFTNGMRDWTARYYDRSGIKPDGRSG